MSLMRETKDAEQAGCLSARNGALLSANPYQGRPDLYAAWLRGYRDAWANVTGTGLKTSAELSPDGNASPLG